MKHYVLYPIALLILAAFLAACSGGKPENTVETFFQAAADGDVEKAIDQISFASVDASEMVAAKGKIQMIVGDLQQQIAANDGMGSLETLSSEMAEDGELAIIQSKITFGNDKTMNETTRLAKEDGDWKILLQ